jgi:hypothetical protein
LTKISQTYIGRRTASSTNGVCKCGYPSIDDCHTIPISHPILQLINVKPETLILLQENRWITLEDKGTNNDFLNRTPIAQEVRERFENMRLHQKFLHNKRNNCHNEDTTYRMIENLCQLFI